MSLKLLIEQPTFETEYLMVEKNNKGKEIQEMFITGPFLMAEEKNKNGRVYKIDEMVNEVGRYKTHMVEEKRALGELNHPTSVEVNPERSCHMITELNQSGNYFMGKSKILSSPMGQVVRSLIMDGVKLGVSSRALGKLTENGHQNDVSDFHLICCDVVHDPSVPDAFVDGILESKEYVLKCDGTVCEFVEKGYNNLKETLCTMPKHNRIEHLNNAANEFINFISSLKQK